MYTCSARKRASRTAAPSRVSIAKATGTSMTPPIAPSILQGEPSVCMICPICAHGRARMQTCVSCRQLARAVPCNYQPPPGCCREVAFEDGASTHFAPL